jgi:peptide deformylase
MITKIKMTTKIRQVPDTILRQKAEPVKKITPEIKTIIQKMERILSQEENGLALAAPQIGESKRIVVIKKYQNRDRSISIPKLILINPVIIKKSSDQTTMEESCLSVMEPEIGGQVARANKVTISTQLPTGEKKQIKASGLLARVFQHEIDHLEGKLFTDRADPETIYQISSPTENDHSPKI